MPLRFRKSIREITLLDPRIEFRKTRVSFEFRIDPLTRRRARIMGLKFRLLKPPDLTTIREKALERPCPFCADNVEVMTPRFVPEFIPEGRLRFETAMVFPNAMPYDQNNAVTIFSGAHFLSLSDFSEDLLVSAFLASQHFLRITSTANLKTKYFSINWNYMPPAGASLIHPHLHLMADKEPSDQHKLLLKRSKRFWKKYTLNYWSALINEEKKLGERYVGQTGTVSWLLYYAPKGMMFDVMGVFVGCLSLLELSRENFRDFARGLQKLFAYLEKNNLHSFNLTLYSGLRGKEYFWTHARIIPRLTIPPVATSDVGFPALMHDETLAIMEPEEACREIKLFF